MPPVDKSILNSKQNRGDSYLDDLAFAVCVNGESLEKYKKIVEKRYGNDAYANMERFVQTLRQQVERGQFTNSSLLNLKYLGKNAGMSEDAIDMIIEHFNSKVYEEQRQREEDEYWNKCNHKDKEALFGYIRKYPKGRYVDEARTKISTLNQEENAKHEEMAYWNQCNPNDKSQLKEYLRRYPNGIFASRATSLVTDLERIEKIAIAESRMFNQCRTQRDYMYYLSKYPNGAYSAKAKTIIEDLGRREIEENRDFNFCTDKNDYMAYLKKYPNGRFVKEAQERVRAMENEEKALWNLCSPNDKTRLQEYLRKYPNGIYATRAKSLIADLERIEKAAIEESRIYNQCRTRADYMEYLRKYPNGYYKNKAQERIKELDRIATKESENSTQEQKVYEQCKTKEDYSNYIRLYPRGKYVTRARNKIEHLEKIERIKDDIRVKQENESYKGKNELGNQWNRSGKRQQDSGRKKDEKSLKGLLVLLFSTIALYSIAYLIRDEYENLGPFLCLVSYFPYMLFAFEVVSNKKLGMAICIMGWFAMMFLWSDYAMQPVQSILPALWILGLCTFFAGVAYLLMYREET